MQAYISILYKQVPDSFRIILRGRAVEFLNIARDLKFPEFIVYKPQASGCLEVIFNSFSHLFFDLFKYFSWQYLICFPDKFKFS